MIRVYQNLLYVLMGVISSLFWIAQEVNAGGIQLYEQAQPGIGTANAGQAALANDASTSYFNPAGMTALKRSELLFGSELMILSTRFHSDANNTRRGSDGGQAGGTMLSGGAYIVYKIRPDIAAGLSITAPVGLGLKYDDDWKGRYLIQNNSLIVIDINPAVAFRLTDWMSIGGGADIYYGYLKEELALFNPLSPDGEVDMEYHNWGVGYNLGVLFEPSGKTRIGIAYRSEVNLTLKGDIDFSNIGIIWTRAGLEDTFAKTDFTIPGSIMASLYQEINEKLAIVFDVGWQDWSSMKKTKITTETGTTVSIDRNWKDTWRVGGGVHYRISKPLLLKMGVSYDSNPVSESNRLPDIPVDRQWRYAAGLDYDVNNNTVVSLNLEFVDLGKAPIDHQMIQGGRRLSGDYDQFASLISLSFRRKFGKE
ncbi:MAG: outer membrane protein transport protein [Chlorobiales bacterium]|nr:outer membrane protein transport protein [Chlorobiales bacterium]